MPNKKSLRNNLLKRKLFQNTRNKITNFTSSVKNYFGRRKAEKEGRTFHPTESIQNSRSKTLAFMNKTRRKRNFSRRDRICEQLNKPGAFNLGQPGVTEDNIMMRKAFQEEHCISEENANVNTVNLNALENQLESPSINLPLVNPYEKAKKDLEEAANRLDKLNTEIPNLMRRVQVSPQHLLNQSKTYDELLNEVVPQVQQQIISINEGREFAQAALSKIEGKPRNTNTEQIKKTADELLSTFNSIMKELAGIVNYTDEMVRMNVRIATELLKRGQDKDINKAYSKLKEMLTRKKKLNNLSLIGSYGAALESYKKRMERAKRIQEQINRLPGAVSPSTGVRNW